MLFGQEAARLFLWDFSKAAVPGLAARGVRRRGEGMLQYCIRPDKLFKSLTKEGWDIPPAAKGYILFRDAHIPENARGLIEMWSGGDYEYPDMQRFLKKLERPILFGLESYSQKYAQDPSGFYDLRRHINEFDDWVADIPSAR